MVARAGGSTRWWRQVPKAGGEQNWHYWGGGDSALPAVVVVLAVGARGGWVGVLLVVALLPLGAWVVLGVWCFLLGGGLGLVVTISLW